MGDKSGIEWLKDSSGQKGATWNPVYAVRKDNGKRGWHCEHASPGCMMPCYAEAMNGWRGTGLPFTPQSRALVDILLDEKMLRQPIAWKRPRRIFPLSMSDIGADFVTDEMLDQMFAVMAIAEQHTFLITTKRIDRLRKYLTEMSAARADGRGRAVLALGYEGAMEALRWPMRNALIGASVEDQRRADERRNDLNSLSLDGWKTWVSYEPAIEAVDWTGWEFLDWMVSGGASGEKAEIFQPQWGIAARDFAAAHGIPYHHKQNGEWLPAGPVEPDDDFAGGAAFQHPAGGRTSITAVRAAPNRYRTIGSTIYARVGRGIAGRKLDGIEHDGFPEMGA